MTGVWSSCCVQERSIWHQVTEMAMLTTGHATTWWQWRHVSWAGQDKYVVVCCSSILYTQTQTQHLVQIHCTYLTLEQGQVLPPVVQCGSQLSESWTRDSNLNRTDSTAQRIRYHQLTPHNAVTHISGPLDTALWTQKSVYSQLLWPLSHTQAHTESWLFNQSINKISIAPPTKSGRRRLDPPGHCHIIFWTNW